MLCFPVSSFCLIVSLSLWINTNKGVNKLAYLSVQSQLPRCCWCVPFTPSILKMNMCRKPDNDDISMQRDQPHISRIGAWVSYCYSSDDMSLTAKTVHRCVQCKHCNDRNTETVIIVLICVWFQSLRQKTHTLKGWWHYRGNMGKNWKHSIKYS